MLGDNFVDEREVLRAQNPSRLGVGAPTGWGEERNDQPLIDLAVYWRMALKHRILIVGCFLGVLAMGIAVTLLMTPIYTAEATLQIDREAARVFNAEDVQPSESLVQGEEFFQTQYGLLRSRSLAERVIDSLGLASSDAALESIGAEAPETQGAGSSRPAARREAAVVALQENLVVSPVRGSRLVKVGYNNPDPAVAARIANGFAENFIQANLDRKFESSRYAREFLEERIAQTKVRLEETERQLVAYAANQQIINVTEANGEGPGTTQSLTANTLVSLNNALGQARAARVAAEERWRSTQSTSLMALPEVLQNPTVQRLTEQRALLQSEYEQKSGLYQPDYPEMVRLKAQIDEASRQIQTVAGNIRSSIQRQYQIAANQESSLQRQVDGLTGDVIDLRNRSIQYNTLQRELDTTRTLYEGLLQRYKEVSVTGGVASNNISIVDEATPPEKPSKPDVLLNILIAAMLGLGLGVVAALVLEALDETVATPEDAESKLSVPVLGVVPLLGKGETTGGALANVRSPFSEAYYSLITALQFSTPNGAPSSILVTSARPAEGKSTTAFATAVNLARTGRKVLLVDGDLRNPSMHRVVGIENEKGMSNLLSGAADIASVVHATQHERLSFISCGPLPPNPAELWGGDRVRGFLTEAHKHFDHVVIDGPPVLGFADAPLLAATVGGVVFVLESRGTRRGQARGALRRLKLGQAHLLGLVLTKFNSRTTSYGGYDYAYDYHYGEPRDGAPAADKAGRRR